MRILILASLLLAACATSAPTMIGTNQYLISSTNYTAYGTAGNRESHAIDQANEFCGRQGGKIAQVSASTRSGVVLIMPTSANVVFSCMDRTAPAPVTN